MVWIEGSPIVILNTQNFQNNMAQLIKEASEVQYSELKPIHQKQVQAFEKIIGGKHTSIFDGIHGMIVDIDKKSMGGSYRFDADEMKKLISLKVRWVEEGDPKISLLFAKLDNPIFSCGMRKKIIRIKNKLIKPQRIFNIIKFL